MLQSKWCSCDAGFGVKCTQARFSLDSVSTPLVTMTQNETYYRCVCVLEITAIDSWGKKDAYKHVYKDVIACKVQAHLCCSCESHSFDQYVKCKGKTKHSLTHGTCCG